MKTIILTLATAVLLPISGHASENLVTPASVDVGVGVGVGYPDGGRVRNRRWACYAENRRGQLFRAVGLNARRVQQRAMDQCFQYSRECRPLGCERVRR